MDVRIALDQLISGNMAAMTPRALYVAFDVFPRPKGSSSHIASMVRALERNFGAVRVLCLGGPGLPRIQRNGQVEIHRFDTRARHLLDRISGFGEFVASHGRRLRCRLAVFRDPWGGFPLLRSGIRCPAVFEVNALPSWELPYQYPDLTDQVSFLAKIRDRERFCLRHAASILCVSRVTAKALGRDWSGVEVIPNVAREVFFQPGAECPIPQLSTGRWCGYIGGLQPWQGVELLVDAFARAAVADARLLILHSGTSATRSIERRIMQHGIASRVLLHPPLDHTALAAVFAQLRFTVAPLTETARNTVQGCCPVKMVESMAAGCPVISSDLELVRELAGDQDALLVPPGDTRALALCMRRLFDDTVLRERLSADAQARARACFSWPAVHARLDAVFQRHASPGGPDAC